ncbi:MFS general substrate transporter [Pleurostoma richardsiae]|uniref:MFS general substrate transporter n=1 Tax=Pleurostoma richardsiae TaxID=41990 RepID=A0AA38VK90_9PEZI|nr:MFS general substrate transporter [Pleurostoma richardsiae]
MDRPSASSHRHHSLGISSAAADPEAAAVLPAEKPGYGTMPMQPDDEEPAESEEVQDGVRTIEAVAVTWSRWGLVFAYLGIFLMAFTTSLEGQTTYNLTPFATSSFSTHSLISTVYVVQNVVNAVIKPPMAKIADVFGRFEAFSLSILLYVLGYIQQACSQNVQTFASAQIFYSAGFTGLQILQQIFIADTSDLVNRALLSSLPNLPFLVTVWVGPIIANTILKNTSWRWGYAMWAVILPVMFLPLACSLSLNARKARKMGLITRTHRRFNGFASVKKLWFDLDIMGIFLLSAAFSLILIPLTLASRLPGGWGNGGVIAMLVVGFVFLIAYPVWEAIPSLAPQPLIPLSLLKSRTFCAGCGIGFFVFMVFFLSVQPYFYSYLLVVQNQSVAAAGHITQTFSFTSTITAIAVSLAIKYAHRYKHAICAGSFVYLAGIGLMIGYRTEDASVAQLVATQVALGVGAGMLNMPAQLGVQTAASSHHQHIAAATAVFLTLCEMGAAVGAAISGAVWGRLVPAKLEQYLPEGSKGKAAEIYASVVKARSYAVGSPERLAINRAYQETMTRLLTIAAGVCVPIVLLGFLMADYRLNEMGRRVKGTEEEAEAEEDAAAAAEEAEQMRERRRSKRWSLRSWVGATGE